MVSSTFVHVVRPHIIIRLYLIVITTISFNFYPGYFRIRLCPEGAATTAAKALDPSASPGRYAHPMPVEVLRRGRELAVRRHVETTHQTLQKSRHVSTTLSFHKPEKQKCCQLGSYLFNDPSDQDVDSSVLFTIENGPPWGRPCYRRFGWCVGPVWSIQGMISH